MITVSGAMYTHDDALGTIGAIGPWWQQLTEGRPAVDGLGEQRDRITAALASLATVPDDDRLDVLARLARTRMERRDWDAAARTDATTVLEVCLDALDVAAALLRSAGALPARSEGRVVQLGCSAGGVPKLPVLDAVVDGSGMVGDTQSERRHHGRPWQALCLWSADVVDTFAAAGHPIRYGAAGENVTVAGLDWSQVRSGVRLALGPEVLVEATAFAIPCAKNAQWFLDGEFELMHHDRGPVSRIYARVRRGGQVRAGDPVVLEP